MAMEVECKESNRYAVKLAEPEEIWVALLCGKIVCNEATVLSLAIEKGLIELMGIFTRPEQVKKRK